MKRAFIFILLTGLAAACAGPLDKYKGYLEGYDRQYFIYAEKETKRLRLVDSRLKTVKEYPAAMGKKAGNKIYRGDFRTPSGVYKVAKIYSYDKSPRLKKTEMKLNNTEKGAAEYGEIQRKYQKMLGEYKKGKKHLKALNSVFFSAEKGYCKYNSGESLGNNAYGPVFMRISYPEKKDIERYKKAQKQGEVPADKNGVFAGTGGGIAIHGTNDPASVGHNASRGCIRMKNSDIKELFKYVEKGTMVIIE